MKQSMDWEDLRLFLAVARAGGLAGAVDVTGISAATLGRRVSSLERQLNVRLVERQARGYQLTASGRALMLQLEDMDHSARMIEAWQQKGYTRRRVRISAGDWTMRLLIDNIDGFWRPQAEWVPEFIADPRDRDVARRQIDIGVRNRRPTQEWLAGQKIGTVSFAAYQSEKLPAEENPGWAGIVEHEAQFPTATWVRENHGAEIVITLNNATLALSLVRQGKVRMVLPTFVGDVCPDIVRVSEPIASLETERWLVMHHDERHQPEVRQATSALAKMLKTQPSLKF